MLHIDCCGGLRCYVVEAAGDAGNLMGDAVGDLLEKLPVDAFDGGTHCILGIDRTDDYLLVPDSSYSYRSSLDGMIH